ncbi:MAG: arylsulfatase [Novosphingobium sp.]|nr:arylsulfatase [Novosphingobium sp.]
MKKCALLARTCLACAGVLIGQGLAPAAMAQAADAKGPAAPVMVQSSTPQAPAGAPNVLVWMLDDVGYAQVSAFGGLVPTPNIDRVARMGLKYTNYHTAPICSAARASLLSGRNPHSINIGGHATAALPFPGYNSVIPESAGSIADNLHAGGYATFALGKWDHLPTAEASPAGPFRQWAVGQGFEKFYGFLAADTDLFHPTLVDGTTPVKSTGDPDYFLTVDLADRAIGMIEGRRGAPSERPFFMYWATGEAHAPHHAPEAWRERFRGKFDMGWDKAREQILKRQIALGIMPKGTKLAQRPDALPDWDLLSAEQKTLYARQMEVFAASLSHADAQFGRILDALEASGELANTVVIVTSDNGASAEGGLYGLFNEASITGGPQPSVATNMKHFADWGGPSTYPHYSAGWAVAGDTPLHYYKQVAHEGGSRVPFVISWPKGIAARGEIRKQFTHVTDVAPTILDLARVPLAQTVNNVTQSPMEGHSFASTLRDSNAGDKDRAQYVELYGNKGLWQGDWGIITSHRTEPWSWKISPTFDEPWELYNIANDPGQTQNLADKYPERVRQMAALYDEQARRFNVNPQHNLGEAAVVGMKRAKEMFLQRGGKWLYTGPVSNVPAQMAPPVNIQGFKMSATLAVPQGNETGPIFSMGGLLGGIGLYLRDGKPTLIMNSLEGETASVDAPTALGKGTHKLTLDLDKGKVEQDGTARYTVTIAADGKVVAKAPLEFKLANYLGLPATFGVGADSGSPVLRGYRADAPFPVRVGDVLFDFSETGPGAVTIN